MITLDDCLTILKKPDKLNDFEWEIIRQHTIHGAKLIAPINKLANIAPLIEYSHERFDGFVWIVGRKKDMIISGGMNVYPDEVEDILYTIPEVDEVAVVGRKDDRWGEAVTAVIKCEDGQSISGEAVMTYCKERLASFKKPTKVIFMDELPHNASGKIKKADIRDMIEKGEIG